MLKRFMAKLGKGAAEVHLHIPKDTYKPSEQIHGEVIVKGGKTKQHINAVNLELYRGFADLPMSEKELLSATAVTRDEFIIAPDETRSFPFTHTLYPASEHDSEKDVYFLIKVDIDAGIDTRKKVPIHVQ
ncbi:sporulation protein [Ectobacillus sp. JY-23]|uniref:sporulation protein n=1 Tax=Ectobacillus sp. JY-23 TaxID=2933872 RepID=UPI001FF33804|nr:sporulation protein [Ectobacillus sp. JY-23]UOY93281.1 sporulation protein [Ectobacillus sp. JY-23]